MIPRTLSHIWVGPLQPPRKWMQTWIDAHPDWRYQIFDNEYLESRTWRLRPYIDEFLKRRVYSGVADCMRYEILLERGGFIAEADSICINPVDELFTEDKAYSVYEHEFLRGGLMTPFLASPPGNIAVDHMIKMIENQNPEEMGEPYLSTGNYLVGKVVMMYPDNTVALPSYTFNPTHLTGVKYSGTGKVYSEQYFTSGAGGYGKEKLSWWARKKRRFEIKKLSRLRKKAEIQSFSDEDLNLIRSSFKRDLEKVLPK